MEPSAPAARPRRRGIAIALVVVASLLAFLALFAIWLDRQLLNTNNWTASSSRLLEQRPIREQTAAFLTDQLYQHVDVEGEIRSALPERAQALAGPAAGFVRDRVELRAQEMLDSPKVQELWEDANREAHVLLLKVLDGGGDIVSTQGGVVVLDLRALLEELEQRTGLGGGIAERLPDSAAQITILESDQLATAQDAAKVMEGLPIVLVGLSLVLFAAALLVSPGYRRRAVRGYGIGLVAAGIAALAAIRLARDGVVDSLSQTAATEPAIRAVWNVYDSLLSEAATATVGYGLVLIAGAWLAGETRWAVGIRRALAPYLREPAIAYGALAALVLIVIVWWGPTPATRNPVTAALLAGMLALGLEGLRRKTAREFPAAVVTQAPPYGGAAVANGPRDEADTRSQAPESIT
jgi:hypothetical protein